MLAPRKPSARQVKSRKTIDDRRPDEAGIALLITVVLLLMLSAIGLSALQSAQGEANAGGRSARKLRTFFAADSALSLVQAQLDMGNSQYPDITAVNSNQFTQNGAGLFTGVRTGTGDNAVPQDIRLVGRARRDTLDHFGLHAPSVF